MRSNHLAVAISAVSLMLAPVTLIPASGAFAQETQNPPTPAEERPSQQHDQDQPNWPGGLGNWDTSERESGPGNPNEAEERGLISPEVQRSEGPNPAPQGTRSPEEDVSGEAEASGGGEAHGGSPLYAALHWVRQAPPDLNGNPVPRPNAVASEPLADQNLKFPPPPAEEPSPEPAPAQDGQAPAQENAPAPQ